MCLYQQCLVRPTSQLPFLRKGNFALKLAGRSARSSPDLPVEPCKMVALEEDGGERTADPQHLRSTRSSSRVAELREVASEIFHEPSEEIARAFPALFPENSPALRLMTPLIDIRAPPERANGSLGRLFISVILKTRTKPASVSANGNYGAERGHRYKGAKGVKSRYTCTDQCAPNAKQSSAWRFSVTRASSGLIVGKTEQSTEHTRPMSIFYQKSRHT